MSSSKRILDLAIPDLVPEDGQEFARRLQTAASIVQNYARQRTPGVLDSVLAAAEYDQADKGAKRALKLARGVTAQAGTLHDEVRRFLSLADQR